MVSFLELQKIAEKNKSDRIKAADEHRKLMNNKSFFLIDSAISEAKKEMDKKTKNDPEIKEYKSTVKITNEKIDARNKVLAPVEYSVIENCRSILKSIKGWILNDESSVFEFNQVKYNLDNEESVYNALVAMNEYAKTQIEAAKKKE